MDIKTNEAISIKGKVRITTRRAGTDEVLRRSPWMKNLLVISPSRGKNLIVQRLTGVNTYSLNIKYGEIGTGSAAPTTADTGLNTPSVRVPVSLASTSVSLSEAQFQFFMSDAQLPNGTYREFGMFVDGDAGTATGQFFNHILFTTAYTKAAGEDTTIEVDVAVT